jgi:hypothetical protein
METLETGVRRARLSTNHSYRKNPRSTVGDHSYALADTCAAATRVSPEHTRGLYYGQLAFFHSLQGETAMPFYQQGNVRIRYEEAGSGFPLLVTPVGA